MQSLHFMIISPIGLERHGQNRDVIVFQVLYYGHLQQPANIRCPYSPSIVAGHNLNFQIVGPDWLVHAVPASADVILELHNIISELRNRLYLDECSSQVLGSSRLKKCRLEEGLCVMLMKQLHHCRQCMLHSVVVTEHWGSVSRPYFVPDFVVVSSARTS